MAVRPLPVGTFPAIGAGAPADDAPGVVTPAFLVAEIAADQHGPDRWRRAVDAARARHLPLHATLTATAFDVPAWAELLKEAPAASVLLVDPATRCTDAAALGALRTALDGSGVQLASGTAGYLAELGRNAIPGEPADTVQLSLCPQVHYVDPAWTFRTLRALDDWMRAVLALAAGRRVAVSPITIAPRTAIVDPRPGEVAPWQPGLPEAPLAGGPAGAAWVAGAIAALAAADRLSFFDLTDGRGLVTAGTPTAAGRLIDEVAAWAGLPRLAVDGADGVTGFGVVRSGRSRVVLANASPDARRVRMLTDEGEVRCDLPGWSHRVLGLHGLDG